MPPHRCDHDEVLVLAVSAVIIVGLADTTESEQVDRLDMIPHGLAVGITGFVVTDGGGGGGGGGGGVVASTTGSGGGGSVVVGI